MSELDDAITKLEEAVARLDAASDLSRRTAEDDRAEDGRLAAVAAAIAGRIDAALARIGQLLEREE